ncbi:flagellar assembly protein FliW [Bacillus sp. 31A1R]|uniref:Flagellar assembly factor FliW n=1 Tax=Robertmurraya mangrovi TaxID=3098077 RepID=A0ABU5IXY0_9BACI|nr:flagellar assembly protein FliW [Bacillus sp. 31A1R]MDZ5471955.1 flagellar assembly protein FliW [Bacillus sp. 31A1R]
MKILTKYHGEVEIEESQIIHFRQGLPGFLDKTEFTIVPFHEEGPFMIMQSIQTPALAFVMISPFDFFEGYSVKLTDQLLETLEIKEKEDIALFVILTVKEPFEDTTANLQGPIVINTKKKLGKQFILSDASYKTKHYLTNQLTSSVKEG